MPDERQQQADLERYAMEQYKREPMATVGFVLDFRDAQQRTPEAYAHFSKLFTYKGRRSEWQAMLDISFETKRVFVGAGRPERHAGVLASALDDEAVLEVVRRCGVRLREEGATSTFWICHAPASLRAKVDALHAQSQYVAGTA